MKKLLVVVDMQKDFVDGALGTKEAQAIVDNVVKKIADFDGDIIATLDTHFENYTATLEGKNLPVPHCIKGTAGHGLDKRVQAALECRGYRTLEKVTFGSVDLPRMAVGYDDITLIGLCTDICVVSNAILLKASYPEKNITVDAACCAGVTPKTHAAALTTMKMCQIKVVDNV